MQLFWRSIKSFNKKEKIVASVFLAVFVGSLYSILFGRQALDIAQSKSYSEGIVGEIQRLNPVFTEFSDADSDVTSLVFSGLVKYDPLTSEFAPDLATYTLSEDQLTYTFTLKNEAFWHDGTEVTAEDLNYTFVEVIQNPEFKNPILKANFDGVKIETPNTRTIEFTLNSPNSFFISALTVGILPHHILGDVPVDVLDTHEFNKQPVGTGPYQVLTPYEQSPDGSTTVLLTRFEEFYGEAGGLETIRFIAYPSSTDLVANRDVWHSAARLPQSLLSEMELTDLVTHQYELPQYTALFINTDSLKMDENAERRAISLSINKEELLSELNHKVEIDSPILQLEDTSSLHEFDLEAAKEALAEADWTEETPLSVRLVRRDFSATNTVQEELAQKTTSVISSQLAAAGITTVVESYGIEELQEVIQSRDFDLLLYGQSLGYNLDIFSYWHSSQATETGLNLSNYQNPKADFFIESIRQSTDDVTRAEELESLAEVIAGDYPAVFLYTPSYYYLTDVKLTGVEFQNLLHPRDRFANIESWNFN